MDFKKQTYSKWTRNKLRVVRRSKDSMKWQVRKQNKTRQDKTRQNKTKQDKTRQGGNPQMSQQIQCDHSNYHNFLEQ